MVRTKRQNSHATKRAALSFSKFTEKLFFSITKLCGQQNKHHYQISTSFAKQNWIIVLWYTQFIQNNRNLCTQHHWLSQTHNKINESHYSIFMTWPETLINHSNKPANNYCKYFDIFLITHTVIMTYKIGTWSVWQMSTWTILTEKKHQLRKPFITLFPKKKKRTEKRDSA